jgi:hypothetical protein
VLGDGRAGGIDRRRSAGDGNVARAFACEAADGAELAEEPRRTGWRAGGAGGLLRLDAREVGLAHHGRHQAAQRGIGAGEVAQVLVGDAQVGERREGGVTSRRKPSHWAM